MVQIVMLVGVCEAMHLRLLTVMHVCKSMNSMHNSERYWVINAARTHQQVCLISVKVFGSDAKQTRSYLYFKTKRQRDKEVCVSSTFTMTYNCGHHAVCTAHRYGSEAHPAGEAGCLMLPGLPAPLYCS